MRSRLPAHRMNTQRGVALLVALMFLIVLTLLGLAVMRGTTLEEKMAGGNRDYNVALQAAEAALRDAENDLKGGLPASRTLSQYVFPITLWGTGTPSGCVAGGLCVINDETIQLYPPSAGFVDWSNSGATSVRYGTYTGATAISGVAQQPRYILELMQFSAGGQNAGQVGPNWLYYVRITARAWGASAQTQVYLQEVYLVPMCAC